MKLFDYIKNIDWIRNNIENKQNLTPAIKTELANMGKELYYRINIDVPGIKVDNIINNTNFSLIKAKSTLVEFKDLLLKLGIFLVIDNGQESMPLFKKIKAKKNVSLNLINVKDYLRIFNFQTQQNQIDVIPKKIRDNKYVAFFDDVQLLPEQKEELEKHIQRNINDVVVKLQLQNLKNDATFKKLSPAGKDKFKDNLIDQAKNNVKSKVEFKNLKLDHII